MLFNSFFYKVGEEGFSKNKNPVRMIEMLLTLAGLIFSGTVNTRTKRRLTKKNDAFLNFMINLAFSDEEIAPEERRMLENLHAKNTFGVYNSSKKGKNIAWCIEHAKKNKISINELVKVFQKEPISHQHILYESAVLMSAQDGKFLPSEIQILHELRAGLKITETESKQIVEKLQRKCESNAKLQKSQK